MLLRRSNWNLSSQSKFKPPDLTTVLAWILSISYLLVREDLCFDLYLLPCEHDRPRQHNRGHETSCICRQFWGRGRRGDGCGGCHWASCPRPRCTGLFCTWWSLKTFSLQRRYKNIFSPAQLGGPSQAGGLWPGACLSDGFDWFSKLSVTEFGGRPEDGKELPKKVCIQLKLIIASIQQFEQTLCHYNANIEGITFITCPESIWVTSWTGIILSHLQDWSPRSWWWRPSHWRMLECRVFWARPPPGSQSRSPGPLRWSGSESAPSPAPPSSACPGQTASCGTDTNQITVTLNYEGEKKRLETISGVLPVPESPEFLPGHEARQPHWVVLGVREVMEILQRGQFKYISLYPSFSTFTRSGIKDKSETSNYFSNLSSFFKVFSPFEFVQIETEVTWIVCKEWIIKYGIFWFELDFLLKHFLIDLYWVGLARFQTSGSSLQWVLIIWLSSKLAVLEIKCP